MGENKIEDKLNIERELLDLNRQRKTLIHTVQEAKDEYNAIISAVERNKAILEEKKLELRDTLADISNSPCIGQVTIIGTCAVI
jgi:chorismate mutase